MKNTKYIYKYLISFFIAIVFTTVAYTQEYTMYGLSTLADRHVVNPAFTPDCDFYFGLPFLSSLNIGYENRGMKILEVLENTDNLSSVLESHNSFAFDFRYSPIAFGFRKGKSFFTFDISNKTESGISLPKDLLNFMWNGNKDFIGKMADFSGLNIQASNYFEYSFGYSYQVKENLRVGAKLKLLRGMVNFDTQKWDMGIFTHEGTYIWDIHSDIRLNASLPLDPKFDDDDPEKLNELVGQDLSGSDILNDFMLRNKNRGMGIDIGGVYNYNEKITLSASVLDLFSSIKWRNNVLNIYQDTAFTWSGVDFSPLIDADNDIDQDNLWEELMDSIADAFAIKSSEENYKTKIGPKFFLAGNYVVNNWLDAGAMVNGKFYNNHLYMAWSLVGNAKLTNFLNVSGTYTMFGSGSSNLGIGFAFNMGPMQIHFITDNILGVKYDSDLNVLWPATSQNVDFRFGMSFVFGRKHGKYEATD
ncbi:MAG: DUF5723 family protein [Bacteroidota bacterium]|nr:DUF5723 family protein [Bacteroidota bacterium]